jgi:hypothetical protein
MKLTGVGRAVLKWILIEAGLFRTLETTEEIAVENFAKKLLNRMGAYDAKMVDKIFNITPTRKEKTGWLRRKLKRKK